MLIDSEHMPDLARLKELLMGKAILAASIDPAGPQGEWHCGPTGKLILSDGTVLEVWGNDGGCACSAGCYPLTLINAAPNIITNVQLEERPVSDYGDACASCGETWCLNEDHDRGGYFRIFVFAGDERINVASFDGSDGNGYYGTGWWLRVKSRG